MEGNTKVAPDKPANSHMQKKCNECNCRKNAKIATAETIKNATADKNVINSTAKNAINATSKKCD